VGSALTGLVKVSPTGSLHLLKFFAMKNNSERNKTQLGNTDYMKLSTEMFAEARVQNPSHAKMKSNFTKSFF
jgi:hypothetical protein